MSAAARARLATAAALFCGLTVLFLAWRDLFVSGPRDVEVWLGAELHGAAARLTAPLHWAIFAAGGWAFWTQRRWAWSAAAAYAFYVALSHLAWNATSPRGGGWEAGLAQSAALALAGVLLLRLRRTPPEGAASASAR